MAIHIPRKYVPLHSLALSLADVTKVFERLVGQVQEQAEIELARLIKPADKSEEDFQAHKADLRARVFRVTVTINGDGGASLFGDDTALFSSSTMLNHIESIYMTNTTAYNSAVGSRPTNSFELLLDFSKPPLLDSKNIVSNPTPNNSRLVVEGDRDAWVAGVSDAVMGILQHRKTRRSWIHKAFIYDLGVLVFGFPASLYLCWLLSSFISARLGTVHPILSAAAYAYVVLLGLWAYRIFFGYTKWAFPTLELQDNKDTSGGHRAFWCVIVLGVISSLAWDVLKAIWDVVSA